MLVSVVNDMDCTSVQGQEPDDPESTFADTFALPVLVLYDCSMRSCNLLPASVAVCLKLFDRLARDVSMCTCCCTAAFP